MTKFININCISGRGNSASFPKYMQLLGRTLAVFVMAIVMVGCGLVYEDPYESESGDADFRLTVNIVTSSAQSTRADHVDDTEEFGSAAENHIDFEGDDFRVVVFDKAGNHLLDLTNDGTWLVRTTTDNTYVYHTIDVQLVFPESTPASLKEDIKTNGIRIMALANWKGADQEATYDGLFTKPDNSRQTLSEIWKDGVHYNYRYTASSDVSWRPEINTSAKKLIPMFGLGATSAFSPRNNGTEFYASVSVPMQRAMAKIEVIDDMEAGRATISDVSLSAFNTSGRFIPDVEANPEWDRVGSQTGISSLPDGVTANNAGLAFVKEGANKWVAYVPEMALDDEISESRAHINLEFDGKSHLMHFALYDDSNQPTLPNESWNHILRNHIYRFYVERYGIETDIHLHVVPWSVDEEEIWDFTDNPSVKPLQWEESTYESYDEETGEVVLTFDANTMLTGSFQIMSPVNARWYVTLVPLGDAKQSAVSFVDKDGNVLAPSFGDPAYCPEISGLVPGVGSTTIYIKPMSNESDQESRFRLEFHIDNMGRWQEVPMTDEGSVATNYTIVRKANLIN